MDQVHLVDKARSGDHEAFAILVHAAARRLDGAARLILRDPELARDAVQDALIRAWRDLPGLRDPNRFDAWLHRLLVHACVDLVRHRRRRPIEVQLDDADAPRAHDVATRIAERDAVERVLRRLDPERRALVVGHVMLGMPLPEIAMSLGIPLGTAKSRLSRALEALRLTVVDDGDPVRGTAGGLA